MEYIQWSHIETFSLFNDHTSKDIIHTMTIYKKHFSLSKIIKCFLCTATTNPAMDLLFSFSG